MTEIVREPISTASSPSIVITTPTPTPTIITTTFTPEEPMEEENQRSDKSDEPPVVEKETPSPIIPILTPALALRKPFRFQGHFNGLIHPFDQDLPAGCFEAHQTGSVFPVPDCPHSPPDLGDHHAAKDYSNLGYHPEPQPLLQNFYYPAEQEEVASAPSRRCSESGQPTACPEDPDLEKTLVHLSKEASEEDLIRSQQVLQELQESVEKEELLLNSAHEEESAGEGCKGCARSSQCLRQMSSKIKTALAVLNWLKEDSKGR